MDPRPHIFLYIDATERLTHHHLWEGSLLYRRPWINGRRAVLVIWEAVHETKVPKGYTLLNDCGLATCVRLDHYRLLPLGQVMRELRRRYAERYLARLTATQGV